MIETSNFASAQKCASRDDTLTKRPTACALPFPFHHHRTMKEVIEEGGWQSNPLSPLEAVARAFGLKTAELLSPCRKAELAQARFAAMLIYRERGLSLPAIADATGRKDHSTVMHGIQRAAHLVANDPGYCAAVSFAKALSA